MIGNIFSVNLFRYYSHSRCQRKIKLTISNCQDRDKIKVGVLDEIQFMSSMNDQTRQKKIVYAPSPSDPSLFTSIYCIEIDEDEEVEWQYLEFPDGSRVVTNYKILSKREIKQNYSA